MAKQDPLEAAKITQTGEPQAKKTARDQMAELLAAAAARFPDGVPADSPYAKMSRDAMLSEGNRIGMTLGPLMKPDEQRLALEFWRDQKIVAAPVASTPVGSKPFAAQADVPNPPPKKVKVRGLQPSENNTWIVVLKNPQEPKRISIGGSVTTLKHGAIIEARHYTERELESMVQQGLKLKPYVEGEDYDD